MRKKHLLLAVVGVLVVIGLTTCVIPGTATLRLHNISGESLTEVWFKDTATLQEVNRLNLGETIGDGDSRDFFTIPPGTYDISVTEVTHGKSLALPGEQSTKSNWKQLTVSPAP